MSYTQNPHMPKVRQDATDMVKRGYTPTEAGRRFGVGSSTVCKWVRKAAVYGYHPIPTLSAKPRHHPRQLADELVWQIFQTRLVIKRSSEVIHKILNDEGVAVSLSSVKRTLNRTGLLKKRSPYKRYHRTSIGHCQNTPEAWCSLIPSTRRSLRRSGCTPSRSSTCSPVPRMRKHMKK